MKKFLNFLKPVFIMLVGSVLAVFVQNIVTQFFLKGALSDLWEAVIFAVVFPVIMLLLSISIDREKCKYGFIAVVVLLTVFALLNIFASHDAIIGWIAIVGNWEFSTIIMIWYTACDYMKIPTFPMENEILVNVTSLIASLIIIPLFMLIGTLMHKKKD